MSQYDHRPQIQNHFLTRRQLLQRTGMGLGALALGALFPEITSAAAIANPQSAIGNSSPNPLLPKGPQFAPKAKRIIHLFLNGGPSQVDTFDPKPSLTKYHGKTLPGEYLKTERKTGAAFKSPYEFNKYGQSGIEVSEIFANVAQNVDDMCIIRSMHEDVPNHERSLLLMNCGEAGLIHP